MSLQEERASSSTVPATAEEEECTGPVPIQKIEVSFVVCYYTYFLFVFSSSE